MKNFATTAEADAFDTIAQKFPSVKVFDGIAGKIPCPLRHGDSLQRMVSLTDNEIIVLCDIDLYVTKRGWDEFVINELKEKELVAVIAYFGGRTDHGRLPLVAHPSFMAFRRSFFESNGIDLYEGNGNDPGFKITERLMNCGRFNTLSVTPLMPTAVEFPNGTFPVTVFGNGGGQAMDSALITVICSFTFGIR
jgi:hypothetical protein